MSREIGGRGLAMVVALAAAELMPGQSNPQEAEDGALGTIDVNGSAGASLPLPKLAVAPLLTHGQADEIVQLVARGDSTLSGQFEVLEEGISPMGPFLAQTPPDLESWKKVGAEYLVRVYSEPAGTAGARLIGEVYLAQASPSARPEDADGGVAARPSKPLFRTAVPLGHNVRLASHQLADLLLGALTGRPGGFASAMVYSANVGNYQQVFVLDADGFNLRTASPPLATARSPSFGPNNEPYYALSLNLSPFRLASTASGVLAPHQAPGSLMGLAFSADRKRMLLIAMDEGESTIYLDTDGKRKTYGHALLANHPAFGPRGEIAYVAGSPVQRIYVDRHAVSPPGVMASSPVFCDTPQGLLVFYTAKTRSGYDIVASFPNGHGLRRFTQRQGSNWDPACSPDGRLLAFFSDREPDRGAGLYVVSIARPWLVHKILGLVGYSLRWEAIVPTQPR